MQNFEGVKQTIDPKETDGYLSQIANNPDEKIGELISAISTNQLPRSTDGKLKVLELGTGGGQSIGVLKRETAGRNDVDIFAADVSIAILRKLQKEQGVIPVATDALKLPFGKQTLSAVNASAVFHEVSSYGPFGGLEKTEEKVYGREAVKKAFMEIHGALMPEGLLSYRDVYCPDGMFEEETAVYNSRAWELFVNWFYPEFLDADARAFPQDTKPTIERHDASMKLTSTKHLHRELQRHYLMLRDYLRTQLAENIGLEVVKEEWIDKDKGIKTHEFTARGRLYALLDQGDENESCGKYTLQSKEYDKLFDKLIEQLLRQESESKLPLEVELAGWKKREGKEVYTYGSISEMLLLACEASAEAKDGYILFPKNASDIRVVPRDYYNRYLREVIEGPEFDGKQSIRFYKVSPQEALGALGGLSSVQDLGDVPRIKRGLESLVYLNTKN
ncbi:methyltransferase domain-containing protein [Patescibacteria group bacterium]|nr:methyltransferase domain-containing protein [Patescibacteria group bacterium]